MDSTINRAEQEVKRSQRGFDQAITHLHETMEDANQMVTGTINKVQYTMQAPRRLMQKLKTQAQYRFAKVKDATRPVIETIEQDRRIQIGIGVAALLATVFFFRRKRRNRAELSEVVKSSSPILNEGDEFIVIKTIRAS